MRLLVLGANGLLGSQVVAAADALGWTVAGTYHSVKPPFDCELAQLDIRDDDQFEQVLGCVEPDWVINCAAMTDVDECENDKKRAQEVNGDAPGTVADYCKRAEVDFAHVSTDYVFDGQARKPYSEDTIPAPLQTYGESKLGGERAVRAAHNRPLIARLSFVYGIHGPTGEIRGFPAWVRNRLHHNEETPLFVDQWVTPTRAGLAADVILTLIGEGAAGTYHIASRSCVTPYKFGTAIAATMGTGTELFQRSSLEDVERPARRPRFTCLDVSRVEDQLGRDLPDVRSDLDCIADAFKSST